MKNEFNIQKIVDKASEITEQVLKDLGLQLVELSYVKESGIWILKVFIYNPKENITLQDCEKVSRTLSDKFENLFDFHYNLEVSSPGVERKIKADKEFEIFKGKMVKIILKPNLEINKPEIVGEIVTFKDNELSLKLEDEEKVIKINKDHIKNAKLYVKNWEK